MRTSKRVLATDSGAAVSQLAWTRFVRGDSPGGFLPEVLLRSWERSRAAGVNPQPRALELHRVDESDLQQRLIANRELLNVSVSHLERLSMVLGRERHFCSIHDRDGIILYATGTDEETRHRLGVLPGYGWSEGRMGTTAAAVCLAEHQPYVVIGAEHYVDVLHAMASYAAPIHSAEKTLSVVLGLAVPVAAEQLAILMLVSFTAHLIEEEVRRGVVADRSGWPRQRILRFRRSSHEGTVRESSSTGSAVRASHV